MLKKYDTNPFKVGDGVTVCMYSDRQAFTVIATTPQGITIQRDKATLLNGCNSNEADKLQFQAGGFCGHTSGMQRYSYETNPNGEILKARIRRKSKVFHCPRGVVVEGRNEFYDFNF